MFFWCTSVSATHTYFCLRDEMLIIHPQASFPPEPGAIDRPQKSRADKSRNIRIPSSPFTSLVCSKPLLSPAVLLQPSILVEDLNVTELDASSTAALLKRRPSDVSRGATFGLWLHGDISSKRAHHQGLGIDCDWPIKDTGGSAKLQDLCSRLSFAIVVDQNPIRDQVANMCGGSASHLHLDL